MTDVEQMDRWWRIRLELSDEEWAAMPEEEKERRKAVWSQETMRRRAQEFADMQAEVQKFRNHIWSQVNESKAPWQGFGFLKKFARFS